ncbi:protein sprint isoform X2 [Panulirus ornatus]|uniref:protein sprint isoform X2 n=1 Tax=Panulirus ornatus TaxID=150431 RepID=UPI003A83F15F
MHEKIVITESDRGKSTPLTKLRDRIDPRRLIPARWRKCPACAKRKTNCICWRRNRRDGVADQYLASVGEPVISVPGASPASGDNRASGGTHHHHHLHHFHHFSHILSPTAPTSSLTPSTNAHPRLISINTLPTANKQPTPAPRNVRLPRECPEQEPVDEPQLARQQHQQRSASGGVRRAGGGVCSAAGGHHRQEGRLMLTAHVMPGSGVGQGGGGGAPPAHQDSNSFNTNSTTSSSTSNTNTSSTSASSHTGGVCLPLLDLDYSGGGSGDHNYQSGSGDGSECEPCQIQLEERLVKTNPIWFLPDLQRSGAVHLLQGKEEGNFIVRQSSKPDTRALSVRLPPDKGPYIQHYLIEIHSDGTAYSLEASENRFDNLPALITYYSQCCDELPVQLRLPRSVQEAKTRHELTSLALLGQEFWGTAMASPTASTPTADGPRSAAPTPSPRPHDLSFSSFGKGGVSRGISSSSLLSPQTPGSMCVSGGSLSSSVGGSTSSLAPVKPVPLGPASGDRTSLNLNLAPLEEFLKDQPTFSSFRSQPTTPVTQLKPSAPGTKPTPPPRSSPPGTHRSNQVSPPESQKPLNKPTPPARFSPPVVCDVGTPTSENGDIIPRLSQAPIPPPRWARSCITTSPSNITVTTTLTLSVNQVKALPVQVDESQQGMTVHVANLEISPTGSNSSQSNITNTTPNGNQSGTLNGYRDGLHLQIRQQITSPQSTPCTPCAPSTPIGEEASGIPRVRLRSGRKDRRRLSSHYHEANIIDSNAPYCRSSLADKISDYEDLWSSPPRELPSTPTSSHPKMSTFKPRNEISKSMGDLSEIAKNTKPMHFTYDTDSKRDDESIYNNENLNSNNADSISSYRKNSSPFYMEPADALKEQQPQARINKASNKLSRKITNRYSDSNIQWKTRKSHNSLSKIDSNEDLPLSSSIENLVNGKNYEVNNMSLEDEKNKNLESEKNRLNAGHLVNGQSRNDGRRHSRAGGRGKPIAPPRINNDALTTNGEQPTEVSCHVASSWEFQGVGSDNEDCPPGEGRFPVGDTGGESDSVIIPGDRTVQDLISEKLPDLTLDAQSLAPSCVTRISEYDNVGGHGSVRGEDHHVHQRQQHHKTSRNIPLEERLHPPLPTHYFPSTVSDSGTEFSEPWDSRKWESIMHFEDDSSVDQYPRSLTETPALHPNTLEDSDMGGAGVTDTDSFVHVTGESVAVSDDETVSISGTPTLSLAHAHNLDTQQRSRITLRHRQDAENGVAVKAYAMDLGRDTSTTFSRAVSNFITCTLESPERDPAIVTRNVRQFMSGMKNYLVTSGEKEFEAIVKKQRSNLKATEFLNLDAILEDVLVRLVLRPLWTHINKLFVEAYTANGSIQLLAINMKYTRSQPYIRLGIRPELSPPSGNSLENIRSLLTRMQKVYAPREKLEFLLATISHIYQAMYENGDTAGSGDADDLVPMIMWVLSHSGMVSAEVEADYMWGLLLPSASSGEASYYLEAFHSAIHALKNLSPSPESSPGNSLDSVKQDVSVVSDQGIMKIVIPDEKNGSIVTRTLPIRPATTTREVCKMMAHKMRVTNPQDYGLYKLVDGLESLLTDCECPHKVKSDLTTHGFHCTFAFKRIDAKIAWPILS